MIELELRAVSKTFGAVAVLHHISIVLRRGELLALLGPSGCGKTTTLRIVAGLETPSTGEVLFDGVDVTRLPVQKRNVGMVSQRYALFPHMTVVANISYGLRVRGLPAAEIADRVASMVDAVRLEGLTERFPSQLSGGQMQRVALARTLITRPSILLLDEPLASLDTQLRTDLRGFIRELQRREKVTTLLVTHDPAEAMEMADRTAVMLEGQIVQCDTPRQLFHQPATPQVARLVGSANILNGKVVREDGRTGVRTSIGLIAVPSVDGVAGTCATVMIRPELVRLAPGPTESRSPLNGRIVSASFHGQAISYGVEIGGGQLQVDAFSHRALPVGQPVGVEIDPNDVWLFPPQAGDASL